jgi:tripartite-type tricarboxylate transporter receptor subunit TctC
MPRAVIRIFAAALVFACASSFAQEYPTKPIRIIVPFAAGGPADVYARFLGVRLQEALGQPVVVEDRPGAGSIIGTDAVAKSAPDGYTLLMMSNTHTVNETLIPNKPYQLMRDFVPIAAVNYSDLVLVVHPSVGANGVADLIRIAKASPGKLKIARRRVPARRTTWPASSSRRWRESTSCTFRTREARAPAPTSWAARCR